MKLFLSNWQIAYRKKASGTILTEQTTPFIRVPNTKRYIAADPFLFTYQGVRYLFAELLDAKDGLGKLGYAVWNGNEFGEWNVVIDEPYHLSYPNIFEYNGDIFIVPESNACGELYAYRAVNFPDKWEKCIPILSGKRLVDTTFLNKNDKSWMFTYEITPPNDKKLWLYQIETDGQVSLARNEPISREDTSARPGGNFFSHQGKTIRVSQDCGVDYGVAIVFSEVLACGAECYQEKEILRLAPNDLKVKGLRYFTGVHTYNSDEELEVIDIHVLDFSLKRQWKRVQRRLK